MDYTERCGVSSKVLLREMDNIYCANPVGTINTKSYP